MLYGVYLVSLFAVELLSGLKFTVAGWDKNLHLLPYHLALQDEENKTEQCS